MSKRHHYMTAGQRILLSAATGLVVAIICIALNAAQFAPLAAWDSMALVYGCSLWAAILRMDATQTKSHAVREDPGRAATDTLLILASIVSLGAVAVLISQATSHSMIALGLGLASVVVSWAIVHTTYTLSYARLYYGQPEGGITFSHKDAPCYSDFAYVAFTVGMTFQVSDTQIESPRIRRSVLKQALLSYLFGTVIIATTINTLASLSK